MSKSALVKDENGASVQQNSDKLEICKKNLHNL